MGYNFKPSGRKRGFSNNSLRPPRCDTSETYLKPSRSRSNPILGRSGIICVTTLKPQSYSSEMRRNDVLWTAQRSYRPRQRYDLCWCLSQYPISSRRPGVAYLIDALHTNLNSCAAEGQHVVEVGLQAIVWAGLDGDGHTLAIGLLRVPTCHQPTGRHHTEWPLRGRLTRGRTGRRAVG